MKGVVIIYEEYIQRKGEAIITLLPTEVSNKKPDPQRVGDTNLNIPEHDV
jgi:hypothetical protein